MIDADHGRQIAVRSHAALTLLFGALYVWYHALWIGRPEPPLITPDWLVAAQLSWGILSFAMIFIYQRDNRSPVLPALFVTVTGATYSYVWYLEMTYGVVDDAMVPVWWKLMSGLVGLILFLEGLRQVRLKLIRRPARADSPE